MLHSTKQILVINKKNSFFNSPHLMKEGKEFVQM